jgi:hypothetical protein
MVLRTSFIGAADSLAMSLTPVKPIGSRAAGSLGLSQ